MHAPAVDPDTGWGGLKRDVCLALLTIRRQVAETDVILLTDWVEHTAARSPNDSSDLKHVGEIRS